MKQHPLDKFMANPPRWLIASILFSIPISALSYLFMLKIAFAAVSGLVWSLICFSHVMGWLGLAMWIDSQSPPKSSQ